MSFEGVIPPMVTPTTDDAVDQARLATFTERLVEAGVAGLLPAGSVGEFSSLSVEQRTEVIETVVAAAGECPVLAGCGGTSVNSVRAQLADAAAAGATAGLVVTPYYLTTDQSGLRRFFRAVAAESPLPIYLYNIPKFTGVGITTETVARLAEEPHITGLKDSTGNLTTVMAAIDATPTEFTVLQGNPTIGLASLEAGAAGLVAGPANLLPESTVAWYDAYAAGDWADAARLGREVIMPILAAKRGLPTPAAFKHLLGHAGFPVGGPLPPLPELTATEQRSLEEAYEGVTTAAGVATPW